MEASRIIARNKTQESIEAMPTISDITLIHELSRNTTKTEYKEVQHWLRDCRRIINKRLDRDHQAMLLGLY
jgi:hypothetical protein